MDSAAGRSFRASPVVLCFLFRDTRDGTQVLMGLKKTGFGLGRVVTLGGHIEAGETPEQAAVREVQEESGVAVQEADLQRAGTIEWIFPAQPALDMSTVLFRAHHWEGEPVETSEILPAWYAPGEMPYASMWPDSAHWMPRLLSGEYFDAVVTIADDNVNVASIVFS
ncbi:8-oxo-dGTP diphosphatase [Arthrobacter sp. zg-Y20]|uniref:8-oxo-dGTP diphosphatase n=1 Tax=unclassified Arthrobacter TaxID=235627 RepID=UPI001D15A680|nr:MULTISPECIES: 8-oxo-dGTP diphosphatase [unclassified Arthrobacter]MCC3274266.1 8-oxo-dGTP diphosphatase [Arthrobacter sp. zg-Y20]MDK1314422.1 8-oxo-dGTP diphosphatase [Arthrobacter sp. zg.Y20]WIB07412.1 8-oxo-dGTP diphosphatase [Arthrobacter sp. zg-Y20]